MPGEPTLLIGAVEYPSLHFALTHMPTGGACFAGVAFLLESYHHAHALSLVSEHESGSLIHVTTDGAFDYSWNQHPCLAEYRVHRQ